MPFHSARAEQSATILLLEKDRIGKQLSARFDEACILRPLEQRWRTRKRMLQPEYIPERVITSDFAHNQPALLVLIGVPAVGAQSPDREHSAVGRQKEIHPQRGRNA